MKSLGRLVADRMAEQQWSTRDVAGRATAHDAVLSHTTVARVIRGDGFIPRPATIDALAVALSMPAQELRDAAGVEPDRGPWVPPEEARLLTPEDRRMLEVLIRRLVMGVPANR